MGYQESLLLCNTKKDLKNLCLVLNHAKEELSDFVSPFGVGRFNKVTHMVNPFCPGAVGYTPAGSYFVWWGGERHPIQSGDWLQEYMEEHFSPDYSNFCCVFCEYIKEMSKMIKDIDQSIEDSIQHNKIVDMFMVGENADIDMSLVEQLE